MKKSIIASAVAAGMLATGAAQADPQVYGIINLFVSSYGDDHYGDTSGDPGAIVKTKEPVLLSNTSAIGVKGSEDLGNGLKAIYKLEWQVDPTVRQTTLASDRS